MTEEIVKSLYGKNIKRFREAAGLTQAQLAEKMNIADKYVSALERGAQWGSFSMMVALANALEVEPYELLLPTDKALSYDSRRTKQLMTRFRGSLNELVDVVEDFLQEN